MTVLALAAGVARRRGLLGVIFFGGLWWTVQKGVASEAPAFWFLGSLLLRTSLILAGFYLVSLGHWSRLVACLLGFYDRAHHRRETAHPTAGGQADSIGRGEQYAPQHPTTWFSGGTAFSN